MSSTAAPPPPVVWAQRADRLMLTVRLENCNNPVVEFKESSLHFKGKGGTGNKDYEVLMEFNKEIDTEKSAYASNGREIKFKIEKKESGWWPRLLKDSKKMHYLKTDFDNWKDEDDSADEEGGNDFNLDEMMQSMNGMPGAGGGDFDPSMMKGMGAGEEESDSDDEDLPDLQA